MKLPRIFVGGFKPIKRPQFPVDDALERAADAARSAMGESHLLAKPVQRKTPRQPLDFEDLPA